MHIATLNPTTYQKQVLAQIVNAPTPKLATANISTNRNLIAARNLLAELGLITYDDNAAELTDKGKQLAIDENIIDDSEQITDVGLALISAQPSQQPPVDSQLSPEEDINFENFSILKNLYCLNESQSL